MKEITEILKAAYHWGRDNGEGRSDKNFNDFLNTFVVSKLEHLVNQEVDKRIAGVMPTKNEIGNAAQLFDKQKRPLWKEAIWRAGANWAIDIIRSRLSSMTEGGGE